MTGQCWLDRNVGEDKGDRDKDLLSLQCYKRAEESYGLHPVPSKNFIQIFSLRGEPSH